MTERSKAARSGRADAEVWLDETLVTEWADAIRPGVLGADESLISAIGVTDAARLFGVPAVGPDGFTSPEFEAACGEYARSWASRVREAIAESRDFQDED